MTGGWPACFYALQQAEAVDLKSLYDGKERTKWQLRLDNDCDHRRHRLCGVIALLCDLQALSHPVLSLSEASTFHFTIFLQLSSSHGRADCYATSRSSPGQHQGALKAKAAFCWRECWRVTLGIRVLANP